ncbi:MAG: ParB/RepB/Spo0J family partition protein [Armatimonadetes bacterium]|nr:ParB/RepB/Spo0J family partition protein [Armatimonadota bacterium]
MARLKQRFESIAKGNLRLGFDPLGGDAAQLQRIPLSAIEPDPYQPRQAMGDLEGLIASIRAHGIVQPLIVSPVAEDRYRIIAGERRFRAALALNLPDVPAVVRSMEEHQRLEVQLIENVHRKDLNPVEEAGAYRRLMEEFWLTQEQMGKRVGRSVATINETLRLLDLSPAILSEFRTSEKQKAPAQALQAVGEATQLHSETDPTPAQFRTSEKTDRPARTTPPEPAADRITKSLLLEIAKQPDEQRQMAMWDQALQGQMTVKQARAAKKAGKRPSPVPAGAGASPAGAETPDTSLPLPASEHAVARSSAPEPVQVTIETAQATVTLTFPGGPPTPEQVAESLRQAGEQWAARR